MNLLIKLNNVKINSKMSVIEELMKFKLKINQKKILEILVLKINCISSYSNKEKTFQKYHKKNKILIIVEVGHQLVVKQLVVNKSKKKEKNKLKVEVNDNFLEIHLKTF